jgi:hypothetical protein
MAVRDLWRKNMWNMSEVERMAIPRRLTSL